MAESIEKLWNYWVSLRKVSIFKFKSSFPITIMHTHSPNWSTWCRITWLFLCFSQRLNNEQSDKTDLETKVSVVSFIGLEVEFGKKLVSDVHSNFEALRDVIKQGLIPNRGTLEGALAIYNNKASLKHYIICSSCPMYYKRHRYLFLVVLRWKGSRCSSLKEVHSE